MLWLKVMQPWNNNNDLIDTFVQVEGAKVGKEFLAFKHVGSIMNVFGEYPNYDLALELA